MKKRFLMTSAIIGLAALHDPMIASRSRSAHFYTDGGGDGGAGGTGGGGAAPTLEQLQAQIADLTGKQTSTTKERDELAAKLKTIEDAQLSESDKLKKQAEEATGKVTAAEARVRETLTRLEIERAARKLSIVDEDAAYALLDKSAITYDKEGQPSNVATLLDALAKAKPYLVAADGSSGGGGRSNPGRGRGGGKLTAADLAKMTPAQISKLPQEEINAALAA